MLTEPVRNNYFYGKLLDVGHLTLEQDYGKQKRWLLNRLTLGAGVLCGLTVTVVGDKLQVTGGVALDPLGREIVVPGTFTVDPFAPTPACGCGEPGLDPATTGAATLWLCYRECLTDYTAASVSSCHGQDRCEAGTIVESFSFHVSAGIPSRSISDLCDQLATALKPDPKRDPVDPLRVLCELVPGDFPEPQAELCVALATVDILEEQHLGDVDECAVRTRIYSQPVLLELIACLMTKVAECCDQPTTDTLQVAQVDLVTGTAVGGSLTVPADPITIAVTAEPMGFRLSFAQAVDQATVTVVPDVPTDTASLLVVRDDGKGGHPPVPGRLTWDSPQAAVWRIADPATMQPGTYEVTVFGDADPNRPPVAGPTGHRLDGEPLALPSGDGTEGGDFTFSIVVTEPKPTLQVAGVRVRTQTGDDNDMTNPQDVLKTETKYEPWGFQLWFTEDPDQSTVTAYRDAVKSKASLLVLFRSFDGKVQPVAGKLEWPSTDSVTWRIKDPKALLVGSYDVLVNGDPDKNRQAVTDPNGQRLDGEPTALPSGDGTEGGSFTFTLTVTESLAGPLRVEAVQVVEDGGNGLFLHDPSIPIITSNVVKATGFLVEFTRNVRLESVVTFPDVKVPQADLVVTRTNADGQQDAIPGALTWQSERVVVWQSRPFDPAADPTLAPGTYNVALVGDANDQHPAITDTDGMRLDGEPTGLPSGDGTEGGTFTFSIAVAEA